MKTPIEVTELHDDRPDESIHGLGTIRQWPGGYAMGLGRNWNGAVTCCAGHETPEAAKWHGMSRLVEIATYVANGEIALWAAGVDAANEAQP